MRKIKKIHKAVPDPIADLITFRALPVQTIGMEELNPFIFLNHHGPQIYPPGNSGLPFGPHPHRGMETVTFILDGDITHKDSGGHESIISSGGIQYMSAGSGLIHAETSSDEFKQQGGKLEILQLWLNIPANQKMDPPFYKGFQKSEIPEIKKDNGKVTVSIIAGSLEDTAGAFNTRTNIQLYNIYIQKEGELDISLPPEHNIFFYIIRGELEVNKEYAAGLQLIEFEHDSSEINIKAATDSLILLGSAAPLKEPIVARGPFVMNTEEEIIKAYDDFKKGKFGRWIE